MTLKFFIFIETIIYSNIMEQKGKNETIWKILITSLTKHYIFSRFKKKNYTKKIIVIIMTRYK